jgi:hypothetical protein
MMGIVFFVASIVMVGTSVYVGIQIGHGRGYNDGWEDGYACGFSEAEAYAKEEHYLTD